MLKHRSLDFSEFSEFNAQADKRNKVLPTRQTLGPGVVVAIVSKINCSPKTAKLYVVIFCGIKLFLQLFAVFIVVCSSQKKGRIRKVRILCPRPQMLQQLKLKSLQDHCFAILIDSCAIAIVVVVVFVYVYVLLPFAAAFSEF